MSGLILPPGVMGGSRRQRIQAIVDKHNRAMRSLHPEQAIAFNRILLATEIARIMLGPNASQEDQRQAGQEALAEVMRREANGESMDLPMWREPLNMSEDFLDNLAKKEG